MLGDFYYKERILTAASDWNELLNKWHTVTSLCPCYYENEDLLSLSVLLICTCGATFTDTADARCYPYQVWRQKRKSDHRRVEKLKSRENQKIITNVRKTWEIIHAKPSAQEESVRLNTHRGTRGLRGVRVLSQFVVHQVSPEADMACINPHIDFIKRRSGWWTR